MLTGCRSPRRAWRRGWCLAAVGLLATAHLAGCSHHKTTAYRPIFGRVATTPCTNCGSGATVTTEGATTVPSATVPTIPGSSMDSSVNPSSAIRSGSGAVRSSVVEPPPKARPGVEPEYLDEYSSSPTTRNSAKPPSSPPAPASPGSTPRLQGPSSGRNGTPSTWNVNGQNARLAGRSGIALQPAAQPGGPAARLEPYVAGSAARELFYPDKADRPWRFIVLHHSASSAGNYDEIDREHRKLLGFDGCGYHFIIGNGRGSGDGVIEVAQRWNNQKQGVHCRNARTHEVDEYGIGICLIGDLDQQPPTPRQVAATRALVAYLSGRYDIRSDRVTTHAHLAATPTVCPGKFFPATILAGARGDEAGAS